MMRQRPDKAGWAKGGPHYLAFALLALVLTLSACASQSGDADAGAMPPRAATQTQVTQPAASPFYVEFRTRPYFSITHIFLTYGAQDATGHPLERKTIGFFPEGGALGPFIGIVGITGIVGEEAYYAQMPSSTTFRKNLNEEQYRRLTTYIDAERGKTQVYNLFFNNCNDFVMGAARAIGLKVPLSGAVPPPMFIWILASMNS